MTNWKPQPENEDLPSMTTLILLVVGCELAIVALCYLPLLLEILK